MPNTEFDAATKARLAEIIVKPNPRTVIAHKHKAIVADYLSGTESLRALADAHGFKTTQAIRNILNTPWAKSMITRARQHAERKILEATVPAQIRLQRSASRMAEIALECAENTDQRPFERAQIAFKAIEYAGEKPAERKVSLNLEAKLGELSVEELEAFATEGVIPAGLVHELDPPRKDE